MENKWTDELRHKMEEFRQIPPDGLWEDIEQAMNADALPVAPSVSERTGLRLWARIAVAAAVMGMVWLAGRFLTDSRSPETSVADPVARTEERHQAVGSVELPKEQPRMTTEPERKSRLTAWAATNGGRPTESVSLPDAQAQSTDSVADEGRAEEPEVSAPNGEEKEPERSQDVKRRTAPIVNPGRADVRSGSYGHIAKKQSGKWQMGIYSSQGLVAMSAGKESAFSTFPQSSMISTSDTDAENMAPQGIMESIEFYNKYRAVHTRFEHRRPVTMGLSVDFPLKGKWSLSSGLMYTRLSSTMFSGSDGYSYSCEQTLHYVGIPLALNYDLWRSRIFQIYLSAGGMAEKNVSGKLSTGFVLDHQPEPVESEKISVVPLQWSVNASAGVQLNFSKNIGLYAEPGIRYYFNNGSDVETYYKETPTRINLQFGLRFNFFR